MNWNRRTRVVSFCPQDQITIIENLSLAEYKNDLWNTAEEMDSFKREMARAAQAIQGILSLGHLSVAQYAKENSDETSAFLGLEKYFSSATTRGIMHRRCMARSGILMEQDRQRCLGIVDPDALAAVAMKLSEKSTVRARIIGLLHHGSS